MIGLTPDITTVAIVRHGVLRLTFSDGLSGKLDVLDRMRGPVFGQARTPEGFAQVAGSRRAVARCWPETRGLRSSTSKRSSGWAARGSASS